MLDDDQRLAGDSFSLCFASPILRLRLGKRLPEGTLEELEKTVLSCWRDHLDEQQTLPSNDADTRALADSGRVWATTDQGLNEELFYYQRRHYGDMDHFRVPHANSRAWMGTPAGRAVLGAVTAAAGTFLERIVHHAGLGDVRYVLDPDHMHAWTSVHQGGSTHPRHVHAGAVISGVLESSLPPKPTRCRLHLLF